MLHEQFGQKQIATSQSKGNDSPLYRGISRRDFGKFAAVVAGATLFGGSLSLLARARGTTSPEVAEGESDLIKRILGTNPSAYGFAGAVPIRSNVDKYLLHIGPKHIDQYSNKVHDPSYLNAIAASQQELESLLLASGLTTLFVEGVNPAFLSELKKKLALQKKLESLPIDRTIWSKLDQEYKQNSSPNRFSPIEQFNEYIFVRQASRIGNNIQMAQQAIALSEGRSDQANLGTLGFPPEVDSDTLKLLQESAPQIIPDDYRNAYAFLGAPLKMYADGVVDILPTSTEEEDTQLSAWLGEHAMTEDALYATNDPQTQQQIQEHLDALESQFETQFVQDRETVTIERILQHEEAAGMNVIPYVFGYGHDLTDQLTIYNQQHPSKEYGLMTVKQQELATS